MTDLDVNKILTALISVIDKNNHILKNHHKNVTIIAYNIGKKINLSNKSIQKLVFASSIHDIGALHVEDRKKLSEIDVNNPELHQRIGSKILSDIDGFKDISEIIKNHHIKYSEYNKDIPYECLILHLADRIDILLNKNKSFLDQRDYINKEILKRSGEIFDPDLVKAFIELSISDIFWHDIKHKSLKKLLNKSIIQKYFIESSYKNLKNISILFSRISDFRSKYFATHSIDVGVVSYKLAKLIGLSKEKCQKIEIAGYLHDIGKLAIDERILSKKSKLTKDEYEEIKKHAYFTKNILENIDGFYEIAFIASSHHEKYNGEGYPYHIKEKDFNLEIDILCISDIYSALRENRPYKEVYTVDKSIQILKDSFFNLLNKKVIKTLIRNIDIIDKIRLKKQKKAKEFYLYSIGEIESL